MFAGLILSISVLAALAGKLYVIVTEEEEAGETDKEGTAGVAMRVVAH